MTRKQTAGQYLMSMWMGIHVQMLYLHNCVILSGLAGPFIPKVSNLHYMLQDNQYQIKLLFPPALEPMMNWKKELLSTSLPYVYHT